MDTYFIGDTHFGHGKIITLSKRPFSTADEMNTTIIQRWNDTVDVDDTVWFLGDFSWKGYENIFYQLNGKKHMIIGNHDPHSVLTLPWASAPSQYAEIRLADKFGKFHQVVLFHYPLEEWNGYYRNAIHLHGHTHAKVLKDTPNRLDVGVDNCNFTPINLDQVLERVTPRPPNRE